MSGNLLRNKATSYYSSDNNDIDTKSQSGAGINMIKIVS